MVDRKCSHCGGHGHNSRSCNGTSNSKVFKLFGVEQPDVEAGWYHEHSQSKIDIANNKGKPWTEEEHIRFLYGLEIKGRGDWKGIAEEFVFTRTPTQVASHAQKYFLRMAEIDKRKQKTSVFDISLKEEAPGLAEVHPDFTVLPKFVKQVPSLRLDNSPEGYVVQNYHGLPYVMGEGQSFLSSEFVQNLPFSPVMNYQRPVHGNFPIFAPIAAHASGILSPMSVQHDLRQAGTGTSLPAAKDHQESMSVQHDSHRAGTGTSLPVANDLQKLMSVQHDSCQAGTGTLHQAGTETSLPAAKDCQEVMSVQHAPRQVGTGTSLPAAEDCQELQVVQPQSATQTSVS